MFLRAFILSILILVFYLSGIGWACESCGIARLGRDSGITESQDSQWFVKYLYENQNWHEKDAGEAHAIHHQGHHVHDKTIEELHHFGIGNRLSDRLSISAEVPYVARYSLEVDNHDILGAPQKSMGLGDLQLVGDYRVFNRPASSVSLLGGVKFPTGATKEENSAGDRFEPELQPGSGSYDYLLGTAYRQAQGRVGYVGNLAYVLRTRGAQEFRFGDVVSTSLMVDYLLNPGDARFQTRIGLDGNIQYERKQKEDGVTVKDSGGLTVLLGPTVNISKGRNVSLVGSFLAPVAQDLGGVHQHLDFTWTLGSVIKW
jgi:hypothetical protein